MELYRSIKPVISSSARFAWAMMTVSYLLNALPPLGSKVRTTNPDKETFNIK